MHPTTPTNSLFLSSADVLLPLQKLLILILLSVTFPTAIAPLTGAANSLQTFVVRSARVPVPLAQLATQVPSAGKLMILSVVHLEQAVALLHVAQALPQAAQVVSAAFTNFPSSQVLQFPCLTDLSSLSSSALSQEAQEAEQALQVVSAEFKNFLAAQVLQFPCLIDLSSLSTSPVSHVAQDEEHALQVASFKNLPALQLRQLLIRDPLQVAQDSWQPLQEFSER
jgi:hypothetical protein